jgi:hypothetical protein
MEYDVNASHRSMNFFLYEEVALYRFHAIQRNRPSRKRLYAGSTVSKRPAKV